VGCSGMILKGFGFVAFFAGLRAINQNKKIYLVKIICHNIASYSFRRQRF
jgi:hypothetical protein